MTAKTSLFNKGIYKSAVNRCIWGSILYTVLLFLITALPFIQSGAVRMDGDVYSTMVQFYAANSSASVLLMQSFSWPALMLAFVVPTVAGLLVFRFMHSKKAAVFTHSLPVTRTSVYVSTVLAAFTLMMAPVVINTVILMIMSVCGFGIYFTIGDCLVWMMLQIFTLFIMFSCTCLVAALTGNSFAMVVLNIFIHTFLVIIAYGMDIFAMTSFFGYPESGILGELVAKKLFPSIVMSILGYDGINESVTALTFITPAVLSIVFYIAALILYKKRNMENAEDVASFRWLGSVIKYLITFTGATIAFMIARDAFQDNQSVIMWAFVVLISAIIYFACEMLLKKSFRVFGNYKGFVAGAIAVAAVMVLLTYTGFFGYETRIPDIDDIDGVRVNNYDYFDGGYIAAENEAERFLENPEVIKLCTEIHSDIIKNQDVFEKIEDKFYYIEIEYRLKNGKYIKRLYPVSREKSNEIMNKIFSNTEYKKVHKIFDEMTSIESAALYNDERVLIENAEELIECVRKDIEVLNYNKIYNSGWGIHLDLYYKNKEDAVEVINMVINPNFENAMTWIKENGYWETLKIKNEGVFYIVESFDDLPFVKDGEITTVIDSEKEKAVIRLEGGSAEKLIEYIHSTPCEASESEKTYQVYKITDLEEGLFGEVTALTQAEINNIIK